MATSKKKILLTMKEVETDVEGQLVVRFCPYIMLKPQDTEKDALKVLIEWPEAWWSYTIHWYVGCFCHILSIWYDYTCNTSSVMHSGDDAAISFFTKIIFNLNETTITSVLKIINKLLILKKSKTLFHCFKVVKYLIVHYCQWDKILTSQNSTQRPSQTTFLESFLLSSPETPSLVSHEELFTGPEYAPSYSEPTYLPQCVSQPGKV